jgi:uncharacterized membrane protein YgcG
MAVAAVPVADGGDGRCCGPALDDPVVDAANALSADTRDTLRTQALQLQARTGAQLQVLVVDHVGDEGIEAYAQRVFDQWQLGRDGVDDGVLLLLVAVQDRRVRIQTGYGLEGAIPDAYAARIIDKAIVPRFRDGDLDQGLLDGTKVVVALIDGEDLPGWEAPSEATCCRRTGAARIRWLHRRCWPASLRAVALAARARGKDAGRLRTQASPAPARNIDARATTPQARRSDCRPGAARCW